MIRKLLKKVLQLTKDQKLTWIQTGPGSYRASHDAVWLEIELTPVNYGTGGAEVARLHMKGLDLTFFEGI